MIKEEWVDVLYNDKTDFEPMPPEGEYVLVSDGEDYEIVYYIMSGIYEWKMDLYDKDGDSLDFSIRFDRFEPSKWYYIDGYPNPLNKYLKTLKRKNKIENLIN